MNLKELGRMYLYLFLHLNVVSFGMMAGFWFVAIVIRYGQIDSGPTPDKWLFLIFSVLAMATYWVNLSLHFIGADLLLGFMVGLCVLTALMFWGWQISLVLAEACVYFGFFLLAFGFVSTLVGQNMSRNSIN